MPHTEYMNTNYLSQTNLDTLADVWANPGRTAYVEDVEPNDDEATRELSASEYDYIADRYERNWV